MVYFEISETMVHFGIRWLLKKRTEIDRRTIYSYIHDSVVCRSIHMISLIHISSQCNDYNGFNEDMYICVHSTTEVL